MAAYRRVYDCRLTAENRDQLQNPTNQVWAAFTFLLAKEQLISKPDKNRNLSLDS